MLDIYIPLVVCKIHLYIIIVCKQTSALHIINPRIYHILRRHVFFLLIYSIKVYNLYTLQKKKNPFRKNCQTKNPPDADPDLNNSLLVRFGLQFEYILHHIQNFTRRRMLNVQ